MAGAGQISKLVAALIVGDNNLLEKMLSDKLEDLGEEFLMKYLGGPFGVAERLQGAIDTGGQSEFNRLRGDFLKFAKPAPLPHSGFLSKIQNLLQHATGGQRPAQRGRWGKSEWATSRNDWLDNHWRHDWRSQPRDAQGRWVPGRLAYIPTYMQYRGVHAGRGVLRKRKARRLARYRGRRLARKLVRGLRSRNAR